MFHYILYIYCSIQGSKSKHTRFAQSHMEIFRESNKYSCFYNVFNKRTLACLRIVIFDICPVFGSPLEHGCKDGKFGLESILFEGQMSSDFLQDLVCNGRSVCKDLRTCCLNVSSLGGSLTNVESLTVSNFTRNLFRSIWHRFE
jgi:hypothetical protein